MPLSPQQQAEVEALRAEARETRRVTVPALEDILYRPLKVLDHGFVRVIDYMGDDSAIVQAARVSYGRGTRKSREGRDLIRYLLRHRHTTPFEMCEIKLHVKLPIFVARQWLRHRTASVNEYSARYSRLDREFYVPDAAHLRSALKKRDSTLTLFEMETDAPKATAAQSDSNKQGRGALVDSKELGKALKRIDRLSRNAYGVYENLLNEDEAGERKEPEHTGVARELARTVLPVNYYTQFYWKSDLHNLLHFLSLRADAHAQYEIRAYAQTILDDIVGRWVPETARAFRDYVRDAASLSSRGLEVVKRMIDGETVTREESGLSGREWRELMETLGREA